MNKSAQHLASFGRNGDDMVMHVSRDEVRGLQSLARAHGTTLTRNPHTGMPEAFNLGKFGKSMLPTLAGLGLSFIPGVGPLMAAGLVGGGTTLATGNLQKGLMAGLGAWGGASLGGGLEGIGAGLTDSAAGLQSAASVGADAGTLGSALGNTSITAAGNPMTALQAAQSNIDPSLLEGMSNAAVNNANVLTNTSPGASYGSNLASGFKDVTSSASNLGKFAGENYGKLGAAFGPAVMEGMTPDNNFSLPGEKPYVSGNFYYEDPERPDPYQPRGLGYAARGGLATGLFDIGMAGGGRLLRGLGDGVSDSIPAQVGNQPVQLADGEFIVPARTVSELGNGSTDAGAKRLREMIERVEQHRRRSLKDYAKDTKAYKGLPV